METLVRTLDCCRPEQPAETCSEIPLLSAEISAGYRGTETLHSLSLTLGRAERLGVVGGSGAGKSTIAMALMGLLPWRGGWAKGSVTFEGKNLLALPEREWRALRGNRIALVPQSPNSALNPCLSLQTHFEEVWRAHAGDGKDHMQSRLRALLQRVDLPHHKEFLSRKPSQISVGQAQRVLIALALLHQPSVLIADEPTSALDVCTQEETLSLLHELCREYRMGLIYISHDLVSVIRLCERMVVLSEGQAVQTVRCDGLRAGEEHHPATRRLLQTLPAPPEMLRRESR